MNIIRLLLGRPLANRESGARRIGVFEGVPAMGLDALSSAAYGPEAALTILLPLGAAGLGELRGVMAAILLLLAVLYTSYRQTIAAYPNGGGGYTVARENLGAGAGLLAAAALMIDYVLNVAVGISAGVGALTSAVPVLQPHTLALCLATLLAITFANLRGLPESGRIFAVPSYAFIASFLGLVTLGAVKAIAAGGHPTPVVAGPAPPAASEAVGLWLLLRAFASGCTAMTGVEAVSNGVAAFRDPAVKHGHRTLSVICGALGLLLAGIAYTVPAYRIVAMDQMKPGYQTVLSQLAAAIAGRGLVYDVAIASLLAVLVLSANTSFVGFPQLCRLVARDDYLPRPFAAAGRRLVFSIGILYLAACSGILLTAFGGITDRLIPLFAIGAFLTFTLSQAGMVLHWRRAIGKASAPAERRLGRARLAINALGTAATGAALATIVAAKFVAGAWITLLVIPAVILLLRGVKRYYVRLEATLEEKGPLDLRHTKPPIMLVMCEGWDRPTRQALAFACRLSRDVAGVHFTALAGPDTPEDGRLRRRWRHDVETPARQAGINPPRLIQLPAPYRRLKEPLLKLICDTEKRHPDRIVAVLIPEVVKRSWWQHLLHAHHAWHLRRALLRYGGSRTVVIDFPWYLDEPNIEEELAEEETASLPALRDEGFASSASSAASRPPGAGSG
ncbi:MAG TPA: APC family permease [Stellaceae bacterium]|nr:APC family permease [Stellaceae bacterium]